MTRDDRDAAPPDQRGPPGALHRVRLAIALGFGSGLAPVAPGTAGTLAAVLLYVPLAPLSTGRPLLYLLSLAGFTAVAVWAAEAAEAHYRRHDVGNVVVDELVGFFATMFLFPANLRTLAVGFALFRFFDIVKIPPARQIDKRWPGGLGVVMDDVVSGIYANLVMQAIALLAPRWLGL